MRSFFLAAFAMLLSNGSAIAQSQIHFENVTAALNQGDKTRSHRDPDRCFDEDAAGYLYSGADHAEADYFCKVNSVAQGCYFIGCDQE